MARSYDELLGVNSNADNKVLKKAYRKKARKFHPDVNPGDSRAEKRFKEIQQAYDVLTDKKQREIYDQVGHDAFTNQVKGTGGVPPGYGDMSDIFGARASRPVGVSYTYQTRQGSVGGVSELFEQLFNQGYGGQSSWQGNPFAGNPRMNVRQRGPDRQHSVMMTFAEAYTGKSLTLKHRQGSKLKVEIPAGIDTGGKVRITGKGEPGLNGGPPGDLILVVAVQDHPYFKRKGEHIYLDVPITIAEAVLSATIEVPTMASMVQMKIPAGTQGGREFRMRGKGFPRLGGRGHGDQIVRVEVLIPERLEMRSRELLREFAELNPANPRLGKWQGKWA